MPRSQPADRSSRNSGKVPLGDDGGDSGSRRQLMRYVGLATELAVAVGISVWVGMEADKRLKLSFPIFSWIIPLLVIVILLVQLIKANSGRKK